MLSLLLILFFPLNLFQKTIKSFQSKNKKVIQIFLSNSHLQNSYKSIFFFPNTKRYILSYWKLLHFQCRRHKTSFLTFQPLSHYFTRFYLCSIHFRSLFCPLSRISCALLTNRFHLFASFCFPVTEHRLLRLGVVQFSLQMKTRSFD